MEQIFDHNKRLIKEIMTLTSDKVEMFKTVQRALAHKRLSVTKLKTFNKIYEDSKAKWDEVKASKEEIEVFIKYK